MGLEKLFGFLPRVGGRKPAEMADGRSLVFGTASDVPSASWLRSENVIREATIVAETVSAEDMGIGDCRSCEARSGRDCQRCTLFLDAIGKLNPETVFARETCPETLDAIKALTETVAMPPPSNVPRRSRAAPATRKALHPRDAARQFVAHLRKTNKTGQYWSSDLRQAYYDFCDGLGVRPTSEQDMRHAMEKIAGVSKTKPWSKSVDGKPERKTIWLIEPETVAETVREPVREAARNPETVTQPKRLGVLALIPKQMQQAA